VTVWLYAPVWLGRAETPARAVLQPMPRLTGFNSASGYAIVEMRPPTARVFAVHRSERRRVRPDDWILVGREIGECGYACFVSEEVGAETDRGTWQAVISDALARLSDLTVALDALEEREGKRRALQDVWLPGAGSVPPLCWRCGEPNMGGYPRILEIDGVLQPCAKCGGPRVTIGSRFADQRGFG
jgi:hypothetical protein